MLEVLDVNNYGLQSMVATGGGGEVNLQSKDVTINQNGTTTVTADTGYDGLSDVDVTVSGILDTSDATATAGDMANGTTAYANGVKITGNIPTFTENDESEPVTIPTVAATANYIRFNINIGGEQGRFFRQNAKGYGNVPKNKIATAINLQPEQIKKDEVVLGVTGTYEGTSVPDWSEIGYSETPQTLLDDFNYSKQIYDNWVNEGNLNSKFKDDKNLVYMPLVNISGRDIGMNNTFSGCSNLVSIPLLDTSRAGGMYFMCGGCSNLVSIPLLNTSGCYNLSYAFQGCSKLNNESLNNILAMCVNSRHANSKTLNEIGLTSTQATTCQTLSNWDAFVEAGWSTGY